MNLRRNAARSSSALSTVLAVTFLLSACTLGAPAADDDENPTESSTPLETVEVMRADITSVVTADVTAVASPEFAVLAAEDGPVTMRERSREGEIVAAGAVLAEQRGTTIVAAAPGLLVERLVPDKMEVHAGLPIMVLRYGGFGVMGRIPVELALRLNDQPDSARVQFAAGPGTTQCLPVPPVLRDRSADESSAQFDGPTLEVLCLLPSSVRMVDGLPGKIGITTGRATDVLALPVTAVAGSSEHGEVLKVVGDEVTTVEVQLGLTDGVIIEITGGLADGDRVLVSGPLLGSRVGP